MNYKFIGWNSVGNHDKVWACVLLEDGGNNWTPSKYVAIYGRRRKTLQTKIYDKTYRDMNKLIDTKQDRKGYINIPESELDIVYPEFQDDLEKTAFWAALGMDYK